MTLQLLDMRLKKLSTYPQKERRKEKRTKKEKKKEKLRLLTVNFFQDDTSGIWYPASGIWYLVSGIQTWSLPQLFYKSPTSPAHVSPHKSAKNALKPSLVQYEWDRLLLGVG